MTLVCIKTIVNIKLRWNYDHSNPTYHPRRNSRVDYTINLHPDISTVGKFVTSNYRLKLPNNYISL